MNYVLDFLLNAIPLGMTFLYGSTGEILTEKVGHLNLGIPGIMCVGAAGGCAMVQALVLAGNVPGFPAPWCRLWCWQGTSQAS